MQNGYLGRALIAGVAVIVHLTVNHGRHNPGGDEKHQMNANMTDENNHQLFRLKRQHLIERRLWPAQCPVATEGHAHCQAQYDEEDDGGEKDEDHQHEVTALAIDCARHRRAKRDEHDEAVDAEEREAVHV